MKNLEISKLFDLIADLSEFKGDVPFKVNAYRRAARTIGDLTADIAEVAATDALEKLPGIGKATAEKIREYLKTGTMKKYDEVRKDTPEGLIPLMQVRGLGPKTLALLHKERRIESAEDLLTAVEAGSLLDLQGFGPKKVDNIRKGLKLLAQSQARMLLGTALLSARRLVALLKERTGVERIEPAGSLRRLRETIGDIDILAAWPEGKALIDAFCGLEPVREVIASGGTKASVLIDGGVQVDLRVVPETSYGAALQYFTGSKAHNVALRGIARARAIKINEYGVFRGERRIGGADESEIYGALDMPWIPPELREDRGEIDAALAHALPALVSLEDIRGDLHVHSRWSDGTHPLDEIAAIAKKRGLGYVLITDHSKSLKIANGLDEKRILAQGDEIDRINRGLKGFRLLKGIEVDILEDGSLDLDPEVLSRLDLVVASVHSGFSQSRAKLTSRVVAALENPLVHIVAHPTGRLIGKREPLDIDMEAVTEAASRTGTALEINAHTERLDLTDVHARMAKEKGARLAIGTDTHNPEQLWMMELGVGVARRAWIEPESLLNCLPASKLVAWARGLKT